MVDSLVSVVIPAYRCAAFIRQAVESILSQTYTNLQVVVVDDGSNDGLGRIVQSIADRDTRVEFHRVSHRENAQARNYGLSLCRGDFIALQDADDWSDPTRFEQQMNDLERTGADLVSCQMCRVLPDGTTYEIEDKYGMVPLDFCTTMNFPGPAHATLLYRRRVYDRVGGYEDLRDGRRLVACDSGWIYRVLATDNPPFKWAHVPKTLYFYRSHKNQVTRQRGDELGMEDHRMMCRKYAPQILARLSREGVVVPSPEVVSEESGCV